MGFFVYWLIDLAVNDRWNQKSFNKSIMVCVYENKSLKKKEMYDNDDGTSLIIKRISISTFTPPIWCILSKNG